MHASTRYPNTLIGLAAIFGIIFALVGWDLAADYQQGVSPAHVVIESLVLTISGAAMTVLLVQFFRQRRYLKALSLNLSQTRRESTRWRKQYQETILGLSRAIGKQFDTWGLSTAEAEIGLLLLKGLSLKEIAGLRGTAERTAREQARAVYRKAGVPNRSALSAFFLEDLLPPEALKEN
ncbi:MAG: hypothetical protein RQ741_04815 [Wenzhouxiangellaceae bacterium]|nr:hypothetical protein [Wenzhouxiangellaceae bacterium]